MQKDTKILWKHVLGVLETEISKGNFITLFKNTTLLTIEDNIATIACPSNMIIDMIQKRFQKRIKELLEEKVEAPLDLLFVPKIVMSEKEVEKAAEREAPLFSSKHDLPKPIGHLPRVRPDFTFETVAVSSSNQLAFISAITVAKNIGRAYNPLFMYGPVGVGKTHLMQAIANDVYQKDPAKKIIYITSEASRLGPLI